MPAPDASAIRAQLLAARRRTLALTRDLAGARVVGPKPTLVNPPLWELGHVGWFQERWCLRRRDDGEVTDSIIPNADRLYDPDRAAPDSRWNLPMLALREVRTFLAETLEHVVHQLEARPEDPGILHHAERAACHEAQRAEVIQATLQLLACEAPPLDAPRPSTMPPAAGTAGDIALDGGEFMLGAYPEQGFVLDNEKWAHEVRVGPFAISRLAVTNREYLAFVADGGYRRREFWSEEGWAWVTREGLIAPRYWRVMSGQWTARRFDGIVPLVPDAPVVHVSWHEAEAWCRYARRRLPTEAEWEFAACHPRHGSDKTRFPWGDRPPLPGQANLDGLEPWNADAASAGDAQSGCRQMLGNVWEWTSSRLAPFPAFVADPWAGYSRAGFAEGIVLRGGSFATSSRIVRTTLRAFQRAEWNVGFTGFRTCAID